MAHMIVSIPRFAFYLIPYFKLTLWAGNGEGDVLLLAVRQHMLLLAYPPFGGFDATTTTSTRLAALIEVFGITTARIFALIEPCPHA